MGKAGTLHLDSVTSEERYHIRSTDEEKQNQLKRLADFHALHAKKSPAMLKRLQQAVIENKNVFEVLMEAVRVCSTGPNHLRPV